MEEGGRTGERERGGGKGRERGEGDGKREEEGVIEEVGMGGVVGGVKRNSERRGM